MAAEVGFGRGSGRSEDESGARDSFGLSARDWR